jgi:hypothetical protein
MHNKKIIAINVSSSFASRAKCKMCSEPPSIYFFSRSSILWHDPNRARGIFDFIKKYCKRMSPEDYKLDNFVHSARTSYFNHAVSYKGYRPKLHRTRGVDPVFGMIEFLACKCGHTLWAFSEYSSRSRAEIFNRKSRYKIPIIY